VRRAEELVVYPNPAYEYLFIKDREKKLKVLFNSVGQLVNKTYADKMDIRYLPKGLYYFRCEGEVVKVVIE
jgi:hypothetical protein